MCSDEFFLKHALPFCPVTVQGIDSWFCLKWRFPTIQYYTTHQSLTYKVFTTLTTLDLELKSRLTIIDNQIHPALNFCSAGFAEVAYSNGLSSYKVGARLDLVKIIKVQWPNIQEIIADSMDWPWQDLCASEQEALPSESCARPSKTNDVPRTVRSVKINSDTNLLGIDQVAKFHSVQFNWLSASNCDMYNN